MGLGTGVFMCTMHVLSILSCMLYLSACCCKVVKTSCSTLVDLEKSIISSAHANSSSGVLEEET